MVALCRQQSRLFRSLRPRQSARRRHQGASTLSGLLQGQGFRRFGVPDRRRQEGAESPFGALADHFSLGQAPQLGIRTGVAARQSGWRATERAGSADAAAAFDLPGREHGISGCRRDPKARRPHANSGIQDGDRA